MNIIERIKMIKAMEFIIRNCNNEDHIMSWLTYGVADGDIEYGDFSTTEESVEDLETYTDDKVFADLMDTFLRIMSSAYEDGGLYCDSIISEPYTLEEDK